MSDIQKNVFFDPIEQSNLTDIATGITAEILWDDNGKMPHIPWLSQTKQSAAFDIVVKMIISSILANDRLSYDENARSGVLFWTLILIAANSKKFKIAIAAAKRGPANLYEAKAFLDWCDTEVHPSVALTSNVERWERMRSQNLFSSSHWTKKNIKS